MRRHGTRAIGSLEGLLTSRRGFGLETATPLQRAICRVIEGRGLGKLAEDPSVQSSLRADRLPKKPPAHVVLLSGIRGGKSLIAAALGVWASQTCVLDHLGPGEIPRFSIVSLKKDLADVVLNHLIGNLMSNPALKALMMGDPSTDSVTLRHPSGRPVEIKVVAGSRAGASVVARWSAGLVADEAPRMFGQEDGVINLDDLRTAVRGRLLPGAQIFEIGSPWAPFGPVYETVTAYEDNPSDGVVVIRGTGPAMNPYWWTEKRCKDLEKSDPVAYQTDVLAKFADIGETMFPQAILDKCTRKHPVVLPYEKGHEYAAAIDPATRGNAWTLVIATRRGDRKRVALCREWIGSPTRPLKPRDVLAEVAEICRGYGLDWAYTDQWAADALQDLAGLEGMDLLIEDWTSRGKVQAFASLQAEMAQGLVEIPPGSRLKKDLNLVKKKATQAGVAIELPKTPDGRHCDFAPALARVLYRWIEDYKAPEPDLEDPSRGTWEAKQREMRAADALDEELSTPWWDTNPWQ